MASQPRDHGLAAELWSISALAGFVSKRAVRPGIRAWGKAGKSPIWPILNEHQIKPHKIRYYLERRDPEFDRKMQEVLMVYCNVSLYREGAVHDGGPNPSYTVTVDYRPWVRPFGLAVPDLPGTGEGNDRGP